jgi:sugar lactone lactonase YvrE
MLGGPDGKTLCVVAAEWQGMTTPQLVTAGSGQVLAMDVDVPGAGWP